MDRIIFPAKKEYVMLSTSSTIGIRIKEGWETEMQWSH